jgi:outer membrane protein OmpA-like peptidoglycan-associated protein
MNVTIRSVFIALVLVLVSVSLQAQTEKKYIKAAEEAMVQENKDLALENYLKANAINPENPTTNYEIGKLYLDTKYRTRSLSYLQKALQLNPKIDPKIHYALGMSYHLNNQWDEAIAEYETARKLFPKEHAMLQDIERKIYECNNGKEFVANPVDVSIDNIGPVINTPYREYAPIVSADESVMIFTTRRPENSKGAVDEEGQYFEDIFITHRVNGEWTAPKPISLSINTIEHDASVGLSPVGDEMFLYKVDNGGDIYFCKLNTDGTWSKPKPMEGEVNSKSYENSMTISSDGNKIFFTSDRPVEGAQGDLDIYMCVKQPNGKWGKPVSLGPKVNTPYAEEAVFLDFDDHTLYFSSKGHKGMGGYDIFKTVYDSTTNQWLEPQNLGYPINSADDDIFFTLSGDGRYAYYSSVKDNAGQGDDDIYRIHMPPREDYHLLQAKLQTLKKVTYETAEPAPEPVPVPVVVVPVILEKQPVVLRGHIRDAKIGSPLVARIKISDAQGNVIQEITTGADGSYSIDLSADEEKAVKLDVEKVGYTFDSGQAIIPARTTQKQEVIKDFLLAQPEVGDVFVLRNIYFDFDQATIKSESLVELNKLKKFLSENPTVRVCINGHTDSKGSEAYNENLSMRRSRAVVSWLVKNGISSDRLEYKGYGESKPLASNDDEDEGREINRRTEFQILSK